MLSGISDTDDIEASLKSDIIGRSTSRRTSQLAYMALLAVFPLAGAAILGDAMIDMEP
jgi:hypothetical protein